MDKTHGLIMFSCLCFDYNKSLDSKKSELIVGIFFHDIKNVDNYVYIFSCLNCHRIKWTSENLAGRKMTVFILVYYVFCAYCNIRYKYLEKWPSWFIPGS